MKKITLASGLVVAMIGMGVMIGCGGGGGGGADSGSQQVPNDALLDTRAVDDLGQNIGDLIPGCVYHSSGTVAIMDDHNTEVYRLLYGSIVHPKQTRGDTDTLNGSCGGTLQQSGTETNMQYQFNDYCTGEASGDHVTLDGSVQVAMTKNGDQISSITASTGSGGLTAVTVEDGQTRTDKIYLDGFNYTAGDPTTMSLNEFKIESTQEGTYWVKDVYIEMHGDEDNGTVQLVRATYVDPEVGAVTLSTSPISLADEVNQTVTITVSSQGQSAVLTSRSGSAIFDVTKDGQQVGTLDCTAAIEEW